MTGRRIAPLLQRLLALVHVEPNTGCWLWTGALDSSGYGKTRVGGRSGRQISAHRLMYALLVGPVPEGRVLDHVTARGCSTRACCNPDHLQVVTVRENTLRGESPSARRARQTHCMRGHPFDESNTRIYRGSRYCRECSKADGRAFRSRPTTNEDNDNGTYQDS